MTSKLQPPFDTYFEITDWEKNISPLIGYEKEIKLPQRFIDLAKHEEVINTAYANNFTYTIDRSLKSYSGNLLIHRDKIYDLFLDQQTSKSVLDLGCGIGFAINDIQRLGFKDTCGITLPHENITKATRLNIIQENILKLTPIKKWDIVISVFGSYYYHPIGKGLSLDSITKNHDARELLGIDIQKTFEFEDHKKISFDVDTFRLLHLINFTKVGGIVLENEMIRMENIFLSDTLRDFYDMGIIDTLHEYQKYTISDETYIRGFKLLRRPSQDEMKKLLKLQFQYSDDE